MGPSCNFAEHVKICVERLTESGVAALSGLFDLTSQRLVRYATTITRNQHDAEDAVQAALVQIAQGIRRFCRVEQPWPYLLRMVQILPYVDRNNAYRLFDQSTGAYARANSEVRALRVELFVCPSFPGAETNEDETAACTTYAGCHHDVEAPIDSDNHGLLFLNSRLRYTDILDGSSQTFLLGEYRSDEDELGWVSGTRATLRNTGRTIQEEHKMRNDIRRARREHRESGVPIARLLEVGGFSSAHPGNALFAFADGSVKVNRENIELIVLQQLGHRADCKLLKKEY